MLTPTHIATGYIISEVFINRFNLSQTNSLLITTIAIAGSMAPDIDGLFGLPIKDHHKTVFHAPIFWGLLVLLISFISFFIKNELIVIFITVFGSGVFIHLFSDWLTGRTAGIMIFYPFSKKQYSLSPLKPEKGNVPIFPNKKNIKKYLEFFRYYFENKFLTFTEILIILIAVFIWIWSP